MTRERFQDRKRATRASLLYEEGDNELRNFMDTIGTWHSSVERIERKGYTYFRYDIECDDRTLVTMRVDLINLRREGVAVHEVEDEAAIRRILNSVKCIEH